MSPVRKVVSCGTATLAQGEPALVDDDAGGGGASNEVDKEDATASELRELEDVVKATLSRVREGQLLGPVGRQAIQVHVWIHWLWARVLKRGEGRRNR